VLALGADDVRALAAPAACAAAVRRAQVELSAGRAVQPLRLGTALPGGVEHLAMPAALPVDGTLALKSIVVAPGNPARGRPRIGGVVLLMDAETGEVRALLDAGALTLARTAAASAVATDALARPDAAVLAVVGTGPQAGAHVAALRAVRPIAEVRVAGRAPERARAAAGAIAREHPGVDVRAVDDARGAVEGADVVCTVTSATAPVVDDAWLAAGTHVNAVGAHHPTARELGGDTMARAVVVVDSRQAAMAESGECLIPIAEGRFGPEHVATEIGEVLSGARPGRASPDDLTVYVSLGQAVQDLAVAALVHERALAEGRGTVVAL